MLYFRHRNFFFFFEDRDDLMRFKPSQLQES